MGAELSPKDSPRSNGINFFSSAKVAKTEEDNFSNSARILDSAASSARMEKSSQKQFYVDPVYKSNLAYRPSDYASPKGKYFGDEDYLEAQEDEKAILADEYSMRKSRRRRSCYMCCCTLCYLLLLVLLVVAIVAFKLVPKDPAVSLGQLNVTDFEYNNTSQQLTVNFSYNLTVSNRNPHADSLYSSINMSLFFENESLGNFSISPEQFEQKMKTTTKVVAALPTHTTTIQDTANAAQLKSQAARKNIQMYLTGSVKGQFKVLGMKVKHIHVDIECQISMPPGCKSPDCYTCTCYT
jgi:hypothetical protein